MQSHTQHSCTFAVNRTQHIHARACDTVHVKSLHCLLQLQASCFGMPSGCKQGLQLTCCLPSLSLDKHIYINIYKYIYQPLFVIHAHLQAVTMVCGRCISATAFASVIKASKTPQMPWHNHVHMAWCRCRAFAVASRYAIRCSCLITVNVCR